MAVAHLPDEVSATQRMGAGARALTGMRPRCGNVRLAIPSQPSRPLRAQVH
jgi:hypothetical protein